MKLLIAAFSLAFCSNVAFAQHDHGRTHISIKNNGQIGNRLVVVWGPSDEIVADVLERSLEYFGYQLNISKSRVYFYHGIENVVLSAPIEFLANGTDPVIGAAQDVNGIKYLSGIAGDMVNTRAECQKKVGLPVASPFFDENEELRAVKNPNTGVPLCGEPLRDHYIVGTLRDQIDANVKPLIEAKRFAEAQVVINSIWPKKEPRFAPKKK